MRLEGRPGQGPSWIVAVLAFLLLLVVIQLVQGPSQPALSEQFAARPGAGDINVELPPVPTSLAALAQTTTARILGGQASAPLTGEGQNEVLRVRIDQISPEADTIRLQGTVTNISAAPLDISLDAFRFTDATNTVYSSSGSPATTLQPNQAAPIDITLPIANPTQLKLDITQPDTTPFTIVLLNTPATPAP
jgi:hypothetical protein